MNEKYIDSEIKLNIIRKKKKVKESNNLFEFMCLNRKINHDEGMPIVSVVIQDKEIVHINSNVPRDKEYRDSKEDKHFETDHLRHAEWLNMNEVVGDGKGQILVISTSPCDYCTERIIEDFNFDSVYYILDKYKTSHNKYKKYPIFQKISPKTMVEKYCFNKMHNHKEESDLRNKGKDTRNCSTT